MRRLFRALPFAAVLLLILTLVPATPALAGQPYLGMDYARGIGLPDTDIRAFVASLLRTALAFVGIILVMQIMWGGFLMMTHGGSQERKDAAVGTLKGAIIGMVVIMSSASAARFVVDAILNAAGNYS